MACYRLALQITVYETEEVRSPLSERSIILIAQQFGIKVNRLNKIRNGIYRVVTPGGKTYSLKRMPKLARLRWIDRMLLRVRRSGQPLAWRNPQKPEGRRLCAVTKQGVPYVLTPWITGRKPSPRSLKDMRACGAALARFHSAGRAGLKDKIVYSEIGTWHFTLNSRHQFILRKIAMAYKHKLSPAVNRLVQRHGQEILRYSNQARAMLRSSRYGALRGNARQHGVLTHGDGGPSNFMMNSKGTYLIDFETLHIDLRAYDLYRVIYNSCKDNKWNFAIAKAILDGYRRFAKLRKTDYKLISVWLRSPITTYMVLRSYDRFPLNERSLKWAIASERRISPFLKKLDSYARKHSS